MTHFVKSGTMRYDCFRSRVKQIHARAPPKSKNVAKSAGCLVALPESAHVVLHLLGSVFCPLSLKGIQRSFTKIEHKKHVSRLVIACRYMSGTREYNPHNKSNMQACVAATVLTSNYLIRNRKGALSASFL